jgi:hypothetical protein
MKTKRQGFWPAIALFFLAPAIGELLSGSAPPAEFFNPFTLILLAALYGSGAILVRELSLRWQKGWLAVFILGAAYGIIEEGWMVKSFFDPNWVDIGLLGSYGRWAGVNWVWTVGLTIYHTVFSITIPILLVEMAFPKTCDRPWIGRRGQVGLATLLLVDVAFGFLLLTSYRPPLIPYLISILATGGLICLARHLPNKVLVEQTLFEQMLSDEAGYAASTPRARGFLLLGFGGTAAFFFCLWGMPGLQAPVWLTLLAMIAIPLIIYRLVRKMARGRSLRPELRLALAAGALSFFILLAPLQEMDQTRLDNPSGMALVGLVAMLGLVILWRRVRRDDLTKTSSIPVASQ